MKALLKPLIPRRIVEWTRRSRSFTRCYDLFAPRLKKWRWKGASHDEIYGEDYFEMVDRTSGESAEVMAGTIFEFLTPGSVLDVGCGPGNLLEQLKLRGIETQGLDCSAAALNRCRERGLEVREFDLNRTGEAEAALGNFDVTVSLEVGHQLSPDLAERYLSFLCRHSPVVLFSSDPGTDDRLPLNSQSEQYWIEMFSRQGFEFDEKMSKKLKEAWEAGQVADWYSRFPMVFRRQLQDQPATG